MRKAFLLVAAAASLIAMPAMASTTVDFSGYSSGSQIGNTYSSLGLTFSPAYFMQCSGGCPAPDPNGWFAYNDGGSFTAFFSNPQNSISFQGVSFTDTLAQAFDANDNLVASVTEHMVGVSNQLNQLTGTGIVRVVFSDAGGPGYGPAITNLTFTAVAGVPEPAAWALMILGFGVIGGAMRRSRSRQPMVHFAS